MQRVGRCARDPKISGEAILLVEKGVIKQPDPPSDNVVGPIKMVDQPPPPADAGDPGPSGQTTGTSIDGDDKLWKAVEFAGELTASDLATHFSLERNAPNNDHDPKDEEATRDTTSSSADKKKKGRASNVSTRHRNKARRKAKRLAEANREAKAALPSSGAIRQEIITYANLTTCLRVHLDQYFENPPPADNVLSLPGRCCSVCHPLASEMTLKGPGGSAGGEAEETPDPTNNRRRRVENKCDELESILTKWREAKAEQLSLSSDQFVVADHHLLTIVQQARRITSIEGLNNLTEHQIPIYCVRELHEIIVDTVRSTDAAHRAKATADTEASKERQRTAAKGRRNKAKEQLEAAQSRVKELEAIDPDDMDESAHAELMAARLIVENEAETRARRNARDRERRKRKAAETAEGARNAREGSPGESGEPQSARKRARTGLVETNININSPTMNP